IPYSSLMGEPAGPETILPSVGQLVLALTTSPDPRRVHGPQNTRYFIRPDGSWEYRVPLQIFPGAMRLKVAGFCSQWAAWVVEEDNESFRLHLNVPVPRSFWEHFRQPRKLEVTIAVDPWPAAATPGPRLTEARVALRYLNSDDRSQADRILATMAPQLFDSL